MLPTNRYRPLEIRPIVGNQTDQIATFFKQGVSPERLDLFLQEGGQGVDHRDQRGNTLLTYCCNNYLEGPDRYTRSVDYLMTLGADPNRLDSQGNGALYLAARSGFNPDPAHIGPIVALAKTLIANGLDVNGVVSFGETMLQVCFRQGSVNIFHESAHNKGVLHPNIRRALLSVYLSQEELELDPKVAYVSRCITNHCDAQTIGHALEHGADPYLQDQQGANGFQLIRDRYGFVGPSPTYAILSRLQTYPQEFRSIAQASEHQASILKLLLVHTYPAAPDHMGNTPDDYFKKCVADCEETRDRQLAPLTNLHVSTSHSQSTCQMFLKCDRAAQCLKRARHEGEYQIAQRVESYRVACEQLMREQLFGCRLPLVVVTVVMETLFRQDQIEVFQKRLSNRIPSHRPSPSPYCRVVCLANFFRAGVHKRLLNYIIKEQGEDIDRLDCSGESLMTYFTSTASQEAVEYLLRLGASVDRPNRRGQTPLRLIVTALKSQGCQAYEIFDLVFKLKPQLILDDTIPYVATLCQIEAKIDRVKTVIAHGADPNRPDESGKTAWQYITAPNLFTIPIHQASLRNMIHGRSDPAIAAIEAQMKYRIEMLNLLGPYLNLQAPDDTSQTPRDAIDTYIQHLEQEQTRRHVRYGHLPTACKTQLSSWNWSRRLGPSIEHLHHTWNQIQSQRKESVNMIGVQLLRANLSQDLISLILQHTFFFSEINR